MSESIKEIVVNMFNGNALIATFIIALLPIFELRGAIPFGMSTQVWGGNALSALSAFLTSFLATTLIIPIVALIFMPLLKYLKTTKTFKKLANFVYSHFEKKSETMHKTKNSKIFKMLGIMFFVAVPLPLTGVYTGTALAVIVGLNFYETLLCCTAGNAIAGVIITLLSTVLKEHSIYILYAFLIVLLIAIIFAVVKKLWLRKKIAK